MSKKTGVVSTLLCACLLLLAVPGHAEKAQFTLPDLDGKLHSLEDYRGKWVLVNYWATWCPPCLEELPDLELFYTESQGSAMVLGVNMEGVSKERLRAFVEDQFLSFPILIAGAQPSSDQLVGPVPGLPTSYLISPQGEVVARQVGQITAQNLHDFIQKFEASE